MEIKKIRGGHRPGAGAKPLPYKTKAIGIRVPVQYHSQLTEMIRKEVKRLLKK